MSEYPPYCPANPAPARAILDARQLALNELTRSLQEEYSNRIDYEFPEEFVDALSRQEVFNKHLFRPNTYLHKWWARRCGSTFRAILKQFVPDDSLSDYYATGGLEGKTVLDPMMGGGTTLHEAIRLGANVIGADIDPIPIIQARASMSQAELMDLRDAFRRFHSSLYDRLGHYFQAECPTCAAATDIQYSLYGVRKKCACRNVVQIDQYDLRHEGERIISIDPHSWEISDRHYDEGRADQTPSLVAKADKRCPACGHQYDESSAAFLCPLCADSDCGRLRAARQFLSLSRRNRPGPYQTGR